MARDKTRSNGTLTKDTSHFLSGTGCRCQIPASVYAGNSEVGGISVSAGREGREGIVVAKVSLSLQDRPTVSS